MHSQNRLPRSFRSDFWSLFVLEIVKNDKSMVCAGQRILKTIFSENLYERLLSVFKVEEYFDINITRQNMMFLLKYS